MDCSALLTAAIDGLCRLIYSRSIYFSNSNQALLRNALVIIYLSTWTHKHMIYNIIIIIFYHSFFYLLAKTVKSCNCSSSQYPYLLTTLYTNVPLLHQNITVTYVKRKKGTNQSFINILLPVPYSTASQHCRLYAGRLNKSVQQHPFRYSFHFLTYNSYNTYAYMFRSFAYTNHIL